LILDNQTTTLKDVVLIDFYGECNLFIKKASRNGEYPLISRSAAVNGVLKLKSFSEISQAILDSVDYVVDLQQDSNIGKSSRILKINTDDSIEVIRD
jgi:tRNA A37 threonylcarbamoyladenosine synthetase subunit TsaC/SUA5/YrdC